MIETGGDQHNANRVTQPTSTEQLDHDSDDSLR